MAACFLHTFIYGGDNLAHGIFCDGIFLFIVVFWNNDRQSDCTLACMVSNGISHQTDAAFFGNLFHNCCLSDARRSDQKNRSLTYRRHYITTFRIFSGISPNCILNFYFRIFNVHPSFLTFPLCHLKSMLLPRRVLFDGFLFLYKR